MRVKKSIFNNRVELDGKIYYFNSLTNAIVQLDNRKYEKEILNDISFLENKEVKKTNKYLKLGFVVNKNFSEYKLIEYSHQKNKFEQDSLNLELFPSYFCNLKCDFCTLKKLCKDENFNVKKTINYFNNVSKFINKQSIKKIKISIFGGEPLILFDYIIDFLKKIHKEKTVYTNIVTNGTLLNKTIIKKAINIKKITNFQFTIDGLPSYHDKAKGSVNSFNKTINGINTLINSKYNKYISIRINISNKNKNSISNLMTLLNKKIENYNNLIYYPAFIHNKNNVVENNYCISPVNYYKYLEIFYNLCTKLKLKTEIKLSPLLKNCTYMRENSFVIAPDLKLYKCIDEQNNKENCIGNISNGNLNLYAFHNNGRLKHFNLISESFLTNKRCRSCSWLPICRGGCPLDKKNDYCKELMKRKLKNYIKFKYLA